MLTDAESDQRNTTSEAAQEFCPWCFQCNIIAILPKNRIVRDLGDASKGFNLSKTPFKVSSTSSEKAHCLGHLEHSASVKAPIMLLFRTLFEDHEEHSRLLTTVYFAWGTWPGGVWGHDLFLFNGRDCLLLYFGAGSLLDGCTLTQRTANLRFV